jgi:hypothetical protein
MPIMLMRLQLSALVALSCAVAISAMGCSNDGWGSDDEDALDGDDPPAETSSELKNRARWQPPGSNLKGTYEGAGAYNGGKGCSKGLLKGTKQVGDLVDKKFPSSRYEGYSCRPNTANKSQLSVHGTGRALDIFASPTVGDQVANHLVNNAAALGIQLVIWNRTIWQVRSTGASSKAYGGPNPHTDHVHAEVTKAVATAGPSTAASAPIGNGTSSSSDEEDEDEPTTPTTGSSSSSSGGTSNGGTSSTGTSSSSSGGGNGGGASCTSDGQCNPGNNGSGLICVNKVCVPGCRADYHCPGILICVGGQCQ